MDLDDEEMFGTNEKTTASSKTNFNNNKTDSATDTISKTPSSAVVPSVAAASDAPKKKKKKKRNDAKNWRFAHSIGVEDNDSYPKFKDKERLLINMANCKYFVIRFVAKHLFNFKLTFKNQDVDQMDNNYYDEGHHKHSKDDDWDIFWTDAGVLPERIAKMKPYQKVNHFPGMF
jgi:tubulin polyglutamylase TTLL6/13